MSDKPGLPAGALFLPPGDGRKYDMGRMQAVFKADEDETRERYSVSEWWLDPATPGPGAHMHDANDEVFYVIAGTASIRIGDEWIDAATGSFVMIPAGIVHDFENRTNARAALLNFFVPGGFERKMPDIVEWFKQNR